MIEKLTSGELAELLKYQDGSFGERGLNQFMAGICAHADSTSGEIDIDRDDRENIAKYRQSGHKRVLDRVFKRAMDDEAGRFMG